MNNIETLFEFNSSERKIGDLAKLIKLTPNNPSYPLDKGMHVLPLIAPIEVFGSCFYDNLNPTETITPPRLFSVCEDNSNLIDYFMENTDINISNYVLLFKGEMRKALESITYKTTQVKGIPKNSYQIGQKIEIIRVKPEQGYIETNQHNNTLIISLIVGNHIKINVDYVEFPSISAGRVIEKGTPYGIRSERTSPAYLLRIASPEIKLE